MKENTTTYSVSIAFVLTQTLCDLRDPIGFTDTRCHLENAQLVWLRCVQVMDQSEHIF